MKSLRWVFLLALICGLVAAAGAQSVDAFFGFNTLSAKSVPNTPPLGGGFFPSAGADLMLWKTIGIGGEVAWRGHQANSAFSQTPYRPIYYDFNGILIPFSVPKISPELQAGFGAQSLRAYQGFYTCGSFTGCTNYVSSNHLDGHLGAGIRFYVRGHIFVRPEVHWYFIRHNVEFGTAHSTRYGVSLGYTLGG